MKKLNSIIGKQFKSKLTGEGYGVFRELEAELPAEFSTGKFGAPLVEDDGGNIVTVFSDGRVCFWDHETDEVTVIARSLKEFEGGCVEPEDVTMDPKDVISAWIDPEFAKSMGISAPKDGWIKRKKG